MGFLYLRYTCDPEQLWDWYAPYLDDKEAFNASANPNVQTCVRTPANACLWWKTEAGIMVT